MRAPARVLRIDLVSVGSRGDVEPLVAVALELTRLGHRVKVVCNGDVAEIPRSHGVECHALGFSVADMLRSGAGERMLRAGSAFRSRLCLVEAAAPLFSTIGREIIEACSGSDAILSIETVDLLCRSIAERDGIPHIALGFIPYGRTDEQRSFYADLPEHAHLSAGETHDLVQREHVERLLPEVNRLRVECLGLEPWSVASAISLREASPAVMGFSSSVLPRPSNWPEHRHVTGFWRTPWRGPEPSAALEAFLAAGEPPIGVGFGSMLHDVRAVHRMLVETACVTGARFVLLTGWSEAPEELAPASASVHVVRAVSHAWLFPRLAAMLHHGGAGTTAASLHAGVPTLIAWFMVDQVLWARTVQELGVGLDLGPATSLTVEALSDAVRRVRDDGAMHGRAADLARRLEVEDGAKVAARRIVDMYAPGSAT